MSREIFHLKIGDWVLVHWIADGDKDDLVHPSDVEKLISILPYSATAPSTSIGKVIGIEGDFSVVSYSGHEFRIIPDQSVTKPVAYSGELEVGDRVSIADQDYQGTIVGISWHYRQEKPIFTLKVGEKVKSKRYYLEELTKIE